MPTQSRRRFLTYAAFAGAAGLSAFGASGKSHAAEPPPETTTIRLNKNPGICIAPLYFAEELLRTEGFTDIRYVEIPTVDNEEALASGRVDFAPSYGPLLIPKIEAGVQVTVLAGVVVGCFKLFGNAGIRGASPISRARPSACRIGGQPSTFW
jgi:NitT/TauT family transport system substrate-binding protein